MEAKKAKPHWILNALDEMTQAEKDGRLGKDVGIMDIFLRHGKGDIKSVSFTGTRKLKKPLDKS